MNNEDLQARIVSIREDERLIASEKEKLIAGLIRDFKQESRPEFARKRIVVHVQILSRQEKTRIDDARARSARESVNVQVCRGTRARKNRPEEIVDLWAD